MKQIIAFLIGTLVAFQAFANINFLDVSKISSDSKLISAFAFIRDNQQYYNHWTNEWNYDKPKEKLIKELREHYVNFSALTNQTEELYLLLGDIAHYLYNLDDTVYFNNAITNYNLAINSNPKDYRTYWFLAYHYALSNAPDLAIDNFGKARNLLPAEQPADFWNEYAQATGIANMPSHCIYAMNKVKSISGKKGSFEMQHGANIYKSIVPVDKDKDYSKGDIWTVHKGDKITFTSRPLGIKILVDSLWSLTISDYQKNQSIFSIIPPAIVNKKGKKIEYTVAILFKAANDKDKLDDYITNFVSKYPNKTKIDFSDKYEKMIAYEIKDKTMYKDIGGGHLYMIGIERNAPEYPGLLLEYPTAMPEGNTGEVTYYNPSESKDRFRGKIFYAIILDSSEDIHDKSFAVFKELFDNQIIIE